MLTFIMKIMTNNAMYTENKYFLISELNTFKVYLKICTNINKPVNNTLCLLKKQIQQLLSQEK